MSVISHRGWSVLLALCLSGLTASSAKAVVLDWNSLSWAAGSLSNSYDVDPAHAGNDVTVAFSGDTSRFTTDPTTGFSTPAIDSTMQGGMAPGQKSLDMAMGLTTNKTITFTMTFLAPQGADGVTLTLYGIDLGNVTDTIHSISALGTDGSTVYAPTITGVGSAVQLSGSGVNQILTGIATVPNSGAGSDNGNATITFSGAIHSITFTFEDGMTGFGNSQIAIGNLFYSPIPEIKTAWPCAFICVAAAVITVRRRRQRA